MSCACSAGPAFEGGDISCGMRATDGAVEACTIDKETMIPSLTIVGDPGQKPVGICGSGIIDIIAELFRCGIINAKGLFIREGDRVRRDEHDMGRYVIAFENNTIRKIDIVIKVTIFNKLFPLFICNNIQYNSFELAQSLCRMRLGFNILFIKIPYKSKWLVINNFLNIFI
jgi:hypothetical protein